jgi:hypothetical protein
MSSRRELQRAVRRAERRDKKRRTKMRVSGKSVFKLSQLMHKK